MTLYIKEVRESKNVSLSELSRLSGIAKSNLSYIESGKTQPTLKAICKIATALEVEPQELFSCDE